jgi:prepilin-type N-terminal cleavage/methylation domain-containing protein
MKDQLRARGRVNCGFTFVEMIVALVLGTLLLTTLLGVMRRCFVDLANVMRGDLSAEGTRGLIEQLRRDLSNARSISQGSNRFELVGFIHRDPENLVGTMRSAKVRYEIRQSGRLSVLVRVQTEENTGSFQTQQPMIETVHVGAHKLFLSTNEVRLLPQLDRVGSKTDRVRSLSVSSIPNALQVVLIDMHGKTIVNHTFMRMRDTQ